MWILHKFVARNLLKFWRWTEIKLAYLMLKAWYFIIGWNVDFFSIFHYLPVEVYLHSFICFTWLYLTLYDFVLMSFEINELSKIYHILCVWMFVNRQFIPYGANVSHCCWQGCYMLRGHANGWFCFVVRQLLPLKHFLSCGSWCNLTICSEVLNSYLVKLKFVTCKCSLANWEVSGKSININSDFSVNWNWKWNWT